MTKNQTHGSKTPTAALNDVEVTLLNTLRTLGATSADASQPSEKIERRSHVRHGPMMHALRELERKGLVNRIVGRKDVMFHVRAGGA